MVFITSWFIKLFWSEISLRVWHRPGVGRLWESHWIDVKMTYAVILTQVICDSCGPGKETEVPHQTHFLFYLVLVQTVKTSIYSNPVEETAFQPRALKHLSSPAPSTYVVRSHRRRVPSQAPDRANCPSEEMTTSLTKWEWPFRERWGMP